MDRRAFLGKVASLGVVSGCLGNGSKGKSRVDPEEAELVEARYTTRNAGYWPETATRHPPYATVSLFPDKTAIRVKGYEEGTDCEAAHLDGVSYDDSEDAVVFDIVIFDKGQDCVGTKMTVWYEAVATFDRGLPESVSVRHNGDTVPHCIKATLHSSCQIV
jgi:hypothetical protein